MSQGNVIFCFFCILLYFLHLTQGLPQNPTRNKQVQSMKERLTPHFGAWQLFSLSTLPAAEILSTKNVRAWVSMVLHLKK